MADGGAKRSGGQTEAQECNSQSSDGGERLASVTTGVCWHDDHSTAWPWLAFDLAARRRREQWGQQRRCGATAATNTQQPSSDMQRK